MNPVADCRCTGERHCRGFTIIEVLVTLVIVGILASAVIPMAELARQRSREQDLRDALRTVRRAIDAYKQAVDEGHIVRKAGESGYPHTLEDLVDGVPDAKDPKGGKLRFLRKLPVDPLIDDAKEARVWGKRSYVSSHQEPLEGNDVYDVYSRATGAGLNGIPYREW